jgi:DNA-binding SARP family transcriptional activator
MHDAHQRDVKCRICVLGAPRIFAPAGPLATSKPLVFGAALYLGLRRGEAIRRTRLAALLWPDADNATRGERLRWLVCKLREAGVLGKERAQEIMLSVREVRLDVDDLIDAASAAEALSLARGDVLAGYEPNLSDTFSRWTDEVRDALRSEVIRSLEGWLAAARRAASWQQVDELARRILALDEFHLPASVALAESLAMRGRHEASLQVLARHDSSIGGAPKAAEELRRQLAELTSSNDYVERGGTLFGRGATLGLLLDDIGAPRISSRRIGLAGPSGMGKTRLLDELAKVAQLRGVRIAHVRCGRADVLRPLSLVADIAHALLKARGALGASPTSLETLRGFAARTTTVDEVAPNEVRRDAIYGALVDLIGALTDEGSLAVIIDDAQWAEPGSWAILAPLFSQPTSAPLSWVVALRADTRETVAPAFHAIFPPEGASSVRDRDVHWLDPLERGGVEALGIARAAPRRMPADVLDVLVRRAAGIPFIIEALVDHWMEGGDISSLPPSVARLASSRLDRLSANGICMLESVAVLGPDADLGALEFMCLMERSRLLEATRELETAGILRAEGGRLSSHALWTETVLARAPRTTLLILHRSAAQWLEHAARVARSTDHRRFWVIAAHWIEASDAERARGALDRAAEALPSSTCAAQVVAMRERCAALADLSREDGTTDHALSSA